MFQFFNRVVGERRSAPRRDLQIPLRYRIRNGAEEYCSMTENVSEIGVIFETEQPMRVGTIVHVLMDMPEPLRGDTPAPWLCTGHVVRTDRTDASAEAARHRVGVQFDCFEVLRGCEFAAASTN